MARHSIPHYAARISKTAQRRSKVWAEFVSLWTTDVADDIRSGQFSSSMRNYFREIGQEALAIGPLMSLDVYARGARRRDKDADRHAFFTDVEVFRDRVPVAGMETMVELCRQESAAWAAGDIDGGRSARKSEFALLESSLENDVATVCQSVIADSSTHVWKSLARLTLVFLETETGHQVGIDNA